MVGPGRATRSAAEAAATARAPVVLLTGPQRDAVSGVSTHINMLLASRLAETCRLLHFVVGREGRNESRMALLLRFATSPFALAATIRSRGVDIVHLNTGLLPRSYWRDLVYMVVARLCGARVIFQIHGGALPRDFFAGSRVLTAFLRATLRLASAIVVLARSEQRAYREFLPERSAILIPNSIDAAPYAALPTVAAEPAAPLRLLYFGRLVRVKGLHEALEAVRRVREQGVRVRLFIAGTGPEEDALKRVVAEQRLTREVTFTGPVFGERKIALLRGMDASILPTYHAEGLPYAVLESMAAGVPVIASSIGAVPDVIDDGVHGLVVPPRDIDALVNAIVRMANDRALVTRMGQACRRRIEADYSVERLADAFRQLYLEISAPLSARATSEDANLERRSTHVARDQSS